MSDGYEVYYLTHLLLSIYVPAHVSTIQFESTVRQILRSDYNLGNANGELTSVTAYDNGGYIYLHVMSKPVDAGKTEYEAFEK